MRTAWLTRPRLVIGAVAATAVAAGAAMYTGPYRPGRDLHTWILVLQGLVLFFYGIPALVADFTEEHQRNTWDLLRLTPLEADEIVLGKLLASTSYAVFLAAVLAPWALVSETLSGAPGFAALGLSWAWMAMSFVGTALTSVAAAAVAARLQGGRLGVAGLALGGLGFFAASLGWTTVQEGSTVALLGAELPAAAWLLVTGALWVFWGAVGAVRQLGRLLSERRLPWALPVFLLTLWVYLNAVIPHNARWQFLDVGSVSVTFPALAALLAALVGREDFRKRSLPDWVPAWATVAGLCVLTAFLRPSTARIAFMVPLFLGRDLLLLARLRMSRLRSPETAAFALLGLLYLAPLCYLLATTSVAGMFWFLPVEVEDVRALANIGPAALHAAVAGALFWSGLGGLRARLGLEGKRA